MKKKINIDVKEKKLDVKEKKMLGNFFGKILENKLFLSQERNISRLYLSISLDKIFGIKFFCHATKKKLRGTDS